MFKAYLRPKWLSLIQRPHIRRTKYKQSTTRKQYIPGKMYGMYRAYIKPRFWQKSGPKKSKNVKKKKSIKKHYVVSIEEPTSIFRTRRRWKLNNNLLVSRKESERRLQNGCLGLAFLLVTVCSLMTGLYSQTFKIDLPTIITPMKREEPDPCKYFSKHTTTLL